MKRDTPVYVREKGIVGIREGREGADEVGAKVGGERGGGERERQRERERATKLNRLKNKPKKTYSTPLEITVECARVTPVSTQR